MNPLRRWMRVSTTVAVVSAISSSALAVPDVVPTAAGAPSAVPGTAGLILGVASAVALFGSKAWEYWSKRLGNEAKDKLGVTTDVTATTTIARQEARITTLENRIDGLESRLNTEQDLRRNSQDLVFTLRMRVVQLEQILREHNIEVPEIPTVHQVG